MIINQIAGGLSTDDATLTSGAQILSPYTAYADGYKFTGTIQSKSAATFTPTTYNQTIPSGVYLSGNQTIMGDSDLIASNIKSGVNIFGVNGTYGGCTVKISTGSFTIPASTGISSLQITPQNMSKFNTVGGITGLCSSNIIGVVLRFNPNPNLVYNPNNGSYGTNFCHGGSFIMGGFIFGMGSFANSSATIETAQIYTGSTTGVGTAPSSLAIYIGGWNNNTKTITLSVGENTKTVSSIQGYFLGNMTYNYVIYYLE